MGVCLSLVETGVFLCLLDLCLGCILLVAVCHDLSVADIGDHLDVGLV